ncbi:MAG: hypothetical protein JW819_06590 [Candidatus Krumholzibacteriota bacterium]|nr:hypothetical protein [Candidatus Krumholzibacteriota bacterium]
MPRLRRAPQIGALTTLLAAVLAPLAASQVLLNELLYDPPGADSGREFVELIAPAGAADLAGLRLEFCNGAAPGEWVTLWEGETGDAVPAGGLFLLAEADVPGADRVVALGLQNGPDAVRLRRGDRVVDLLGYGEGLDPSLCEAWPAADASGRSLARRPDGVDTEQNALDWVAADPTPGAMNFPAFRVRLEEALAPPPPVAPGDTLRLGVRARNAGLAAWPGPLRLAARAPAGDILAEAALPAVLPDHASEALLAVQAPAAGPWDLVVLAGPAGGSFADSLCWRGRVGPGPLLLAEVLFAPDAGEPEWVECLAREPLAGVEAFTLSDLGGTTAGFRPPPLAAGGRFLLCGDRDALLSRRPELPADRVLDLSPWPSLANSGESDQSPGWTDGLRLADAAGRSVDGMLYQGGWVPGGGVSLERLHVHAPPGLAAWAPCPGGATPLAGGDPEPGAPTAILALVPNPFDPRRERSELRLRITADRPRLRLFDAAGRAVQMLEGAAGGGLLRLLWDGRDETGRPLPDGAYPFRVEWTDAAGAPRSLAGVWGLRRGAP